ncbi:SDR family oxidoreductase [Bdellovibrio sp. HCB2-146]|uniref:SDR family oxidoreductase n=1 Tax=Bdellovibrio sp. HCB2-146 TaxID=3394362 RepID=UPI0039BC2E4D
MFSWDLSGKTALVCGASEGIGRASAELMAERGARIIAVSRTEEKLKKFISELSGKNHEYFAIDLADTEAIQKSLLPKLQKQEIHILINNAGGPPGGLLHETKVEAFETPLRAHLYAAHLITQAVLPAMKKNSYGRVINIISTSVKTPIPNLGVSNTVRAAMANWSKTMAGELAPYGITVNNILPGFIKTGRLESLLKSNAERQKISEDIAEEQMRDSIPMKRIGNPREVAEVISFLASPAASYVTGINVPVDGGRTPSL